MREPLDSLDASMEDFEPTTPARFAYPSHHSGFRSEAGTNDGATDPDPQDQDSASAGGYSPPAWRRLENGDRSNGFWRPGNNILGGFDRHSRQLSPEYSEMGDENDGDVFARAVRTRLPTSPEKGQSPDMDREQTAMPLKITNTAESKTPVQENFIRFAVRAEVQQRTEPIDAAISFVRTRVLAMTRTWTTLGTSILFAIASFIFVRSLFQPLGQAPVPDLVKVAGLARSFEPLIYYSEHGAAQVGDLQATSVAVWDLGESVRTSNMSSAAAIVKELDDLSESLKTLAVEQTKFFATVDGDIDGILIVMEWARRELSQVNQPISQPFTSALDNVHQSLSYVGILESDNGTPTALGRIVTSIFGKTPTQRTRQMLQRTFAEFLSVLEEAIDSELQSSLALFSLFEAIDHQFLNLARNVVRESSLEDDAHADMLASLWTRMLGTNAARVRKYERNRDLLRDVREKTVRNKGVLMDHNNRLLALKASLDSLRRKLVSPLVRSVNSTSLTLEEQITGLEDVRGYLQGVRKQQKDKLMTVLFGGSKGGRMTIDEKQT